MWHVVALALLANGNGREVVCSCRCDVPAATAAPAEAGPAPIPPPTAALRAPELGPQALPKSALAFNVGVASAIGEIGVTYLMSAAAPFELEVGLGQGYSGTQLSLMGKLSFGSRNHRGTTGIGVASTIAPAAVTRDNPTWLNVDIIGYEFRSDGGFFFAVAGGLYKGLGGGAVCQGDCEGGNQYAADVTRMMGGQGRVLVGATF